MCNEASVHAGDRNLDTSNLAGSPSQSTTALQDSRAQLSGALAAAEPEAGDSNARIHAELDALLAELDELALKMSPSGSPSPAEAGPDPVGDEVALADLDG